MARIILTEKQLKNLTKNLSEGTIQRGEFGDKVTVYVDTYDVTINGNSIDWATCSDMNLTYDIHIEYSSWGINGIELGNIKGPKEIEIEIKPENEDAEDVYLSLPYNWDNVVVEEENGKSITIGDEITIKLKNDENGDVVIDEIVVPIYTL